MDFTGIGTALIGVLNVYFRSARGTGRTTQLIQSVKDGDRIVVPSQREKERYQRILKTRGLLVDVVVLSPTAIYHVGELGTSQGRTIFDHQWVEMFHTASLDRSIKKLDALQKHLSGWGEEHERTRAQAEQLSKWGYTD